MKILFLAPQPFFEDRGTPIAIRLAVTVLGEREGDTIDLLTYHIGRDLGAKEFSHHRIIPPPFVHHVRPGISLKKIWCDLFFLCSTLSLMWRNRREPYQIVHAVEESVFIALLLKWITKTPYIYDMDSSMVLQLVEKWRWLRPFQRILDWFERIAVRHALAVVPVCDALAVIAADHGSRRTHILRDISLLNFESEPDHSANGGAKQEEPINLRNEAMLPPDTPLILYIGNLESYQGVDILIDGFAEIAAAFPDAHLGIIGGSDADISAYRERAVERGIGSRVHFYGPRPVQHLSAYLDQGDILASPRTQGNNTPMKIYSYLHSGKAILATDLPTHTQVLNPQVAELVPATADGIADGLRHLLGSETVMAELGQAAFDLAEERYTYDVFEQRLNELYDQIGQGEIGQGEGFTSELIPAHQKVAHQKAAHQKAAHQKATHKGM